MRELASWQHCRTHAPMVHMKPEPIHCYDPPSIDAAATLLDSSRYVFVRSPSRNARRPDGCRSGDTQCHRESNEIVCPRHTMLCLDVAARVSDRLNRCSAHPRFQLGSYPRTQPSRNLIHSNHGFANSRPGHSTSQQSMCQKPLTCDLGKSGATQFPRHSRCDVSVRRSWRYGAPNNGAPA